MPAPVLNLSIVEGVAAPPLAGNAYFDLLRARPDYWKGYTLRSQAQLDLYKHASSQPSFVRYDPTMDAAKVIIPVIDTRFAYSALAAAIDATATTLTLTVWHSELTVGRGIKVDDELMRIVTIQASTKTLTVTRARAGTAAAAHASGRAIYIGNNSLLNQVRLPIGATAGASYLLTWDARWTESFLSSGLTNHKAFQCSKSPDAIGLETQTRFDGKFSSGFTPSTDIASVTLRSYGATVMDPVTPKAGQFIVKPDRWTRYWLRVAINTTGLDPVSLWIADTQTGPTQVYADVPIAVPEIVRFWLEFNTSTNALTRANLRDLVAYVRNVVVLRNTPAADLASLLVRPA